ncbi:MAG: serine hydrolase, partial [Polymorphobacter sp.]
MLGVISAAAFAGATPAFAQRTAPEFGNVQGLIDQYVAAKRVPGAVVAVVQADRPVQYLMSGQTAFEGGVPVSPDTLWRIYS